MRDGLRLLDLGWVSGLRSQTVWHAIAETMGARDRATLCLCSPTDPYVSIGYHRRLDEIDLDACERRGFRIYRRRVGGGPVLCDSRQLFFQLIAPARAFPAMLDKAWARAMEPAAAAFRALGIEASLSEGNDLVAGGRKISGTGAARIGDAMVFVGNVLFGFDHEAMADVLNIPAEAKAEAARLMRANLATVDEAAGREVERMEAVGSLVGAYADAFGPARRSTLRDEEAAAARALDALFSSSSWVAAERPPQPARIKIRAGVSLALQDGAWIEVTDDVAHAGAPGGGV